MRSGGVYPFYAVMKYFSKKLYFSRGSFLYHWDMISSILQDVCFIGKKFLRQTPPNAAKREKEVAYRFSWISNSA